MTEAMMYDAATKLGVAAFLGVLLYVVLIRVGTAIVASQDRVALAVTQQTTAITALTTALTRVEAKLDHQLAIDRDRDALAKFKARGTAPGSHQAPSLVREVLPPSDSGDGR